ncbi:MAG: hypothetical protein ACHQAX_09975 [Gammaproteobacteria bacterium]
MKKLNPLDDHRYFFHYLGVETVDANALAVLLRDENPIFRPNHGDEDHPYREVGNAWITFHQMIQHNLFYLNHYSNLNDPFECLVNINYSAGAEYSAIAEYHEKIVKPKDEIPLNAYVELVVSGAREGYRHLYEPKDPNDSLPFGIISLTENPVNIQMWSCYANKHTGVSIIFEIDWERIVSEIKKSGVTEQHIISELKTSGLQFSLLTDTGERMPFGFQKVQYFPCVIEHPLNNFFKAFFDV